MKTVNEALKMAATIEKEVNELPDQNLFGDSNMSEKEQLRDWILALRQYAEHGILPVEDDLLKVRLWLTYEWSVLDDYIESLIALLVRIDGGG